MRITASTAILLSSLFLPNVFAAPAPLPPKPFETNNKEYLASLKENGHGKRDALLSTGIGPACGGTNCVKSPWLTNTQLLNKYPDLFAQPQVKKPVAPKAKDELRNKYPDMFPKTATGQPVEPKSVARRDESPEKREAVKLPCDGANCQRRKRMVDNTPSAPKPQPLKYKFNLKDCPGPNCPLKSNRVVTLPGGPLLRNGEFIKTRGDNDVKHIQTTDTENKPGAPARKLDGETRRPIAVQ
ncbi:hypothetical protein B0O99DRAFT_606563 [Bisporella sp. PMI_857]|nr:hypothetical protein B0O99DRAFT_606563 [Bisporella sp. PMI_857]